MADKYFDKFRRRHTPHLQQHAVKLRYERAQRLRQEWAPRSTLNCGYSQKKWDKKRTPENKNKKEKTRQKSPGEKKWGKTTPSEKKRKRGKKTPTKLLVLCGCFFIRNIHKNSWLFGDVFYENTHRFFNENRQIINLSKSTHEHDIYVSFYGCFNQKYP